MHTRRFASPTFRRSLALAGLLVAATLGGTGCSESQGRGALIGAAVGAGVGLVIASETYDHDPHPTYRPAYEPHGGYDYGYEPDYAYDVPQSPYGCD